MVKHTPGPWEVKANYVIFSGRTILFEVRSVGPTAIEQSEAKANGKLIAAAPELLDCCQRMVKIFESEPEALGIYSAHLKLIEEAINKATT